MSEDGRKNNGGEREGAGRPVASATLIKQEFRKALAERIKRDADKWIDAIQDSALGHYMEVKQADGTIKVYKTKPDPNAWQKGMDRAFGSPEQDILSGGEKVTFIVQAYKPDGDKNSV